MNDGGPAFPVHRVDEIREGMSLRDYFAAAALTGLRAQYGEGEVSNEWLAEIAFNSADAMLAEREKGK